MGSGVVLGLDPLAVTDGKTWGLTLAPGFFVEEDQPHWELGHSVDETIGSLGDFLLTRQLRHPRDAWWPVVAEDDEGPVRLVGMLTVSTAATLFSESGYAVVYLEDLPPYQSITFLSSTGLTLSPLTSSYNRYRFDASLVGDVVDVDYLLGRAITHSGLSAITCSGPVTNLRIEYRTDIPVGKVTDAWYIEPHFTGWTATGALVTLVTNAYGLEYATAIATSPYAQLQTTVTQDTKRSYLFTADFYLEAGDVRLSVEGFPGFHTAKLGRNYVSIPCEGTALTMTMTLGATGSSVTWYGAYLVEGFESGNRKWVGAPAYQSYISSMPFASTPTHMEVEVNSPYQADFTSTWSVAAPFWVKASVVGMVSGVTVPYLGTVLATLDGVTAVPTIYADVPGEYYFTCAPASLATLSLMAGAVLGTATLLPVDGHLDTTYSLWLDVRSEPDGVSHRVKPLLLAWDGLRTSVSASLCTVVVVGGAFSGSSATTSLITLNGEGVIRGGQYAYVELQVGSDLYLSPRVSLPNWGGLLPQSLLPLSSDIPA